MLFFVVAGYFVLLALIGFWARKSDSIDDYILAGRRLSFPVLLATIVTTFYGATAILGGAELSYYFGLGALWFMVPFYAGNVLVLFFIRRIESRGSETLPDFLGSFYGSRVAAAAAILLSLLCLVPGSIIAAGKLMHYIQPVSAEAWMVLVSAVVVLYTLYGGMRAVSYSDVLQFLLMVAALLVLFPYALSYSPNFIKETPSENLSPLPYMQMFPQDAVRWTLLLLFLPITSAPLYQRFFASLPKTNRRKAVAFSILIYFVIDIIVLSSGMIASVNSQALNLSEENADISLLVLGLSVLPRALKVLFALGLLAAIMSTADSWLHAGASSLAYDVYRRIRPSGDARLVSVSQVFVFVLGLLSLTLALYFKDVLAALTFLLTVWVSGILPATLAALFDFRLSGKAALASILAGGASSIAWGLKPPLAVDPLFIGLFFSFSSALILESGFKRFFPA